MALGSASVPGLTPEATLRSDGVQQRRLHGQRHQGQPHRPARAPRQRRVRHPPGRPGRVRRRFPRPRRECCGEQRSPGPREPKPTAEPSPIASEQRHTRILGQRRNSTLGQCSGMTPERDRLLRRGCHVDGKMSPMGDPAATGAGETLKQLTSAIDGHLGSGLLGLYLFGSLAAGGFYPGKSDLDLMAIVAAGLSTTDFSWRRQQSSRWRSSSRAVAAGRRRDDPEATALRLIGRALRIQPRSSSRRMRRPCARLIRAPLPPSPALLHPPCEPRDAAARR